MVEMAQTSVKMCKPIYIGMSILDISKTQIYAFHYGYMEPRYGQNCKVLYTDTDSLIYHVACEDIYADMKANSSNSEQNVFGMRLRNKKAPGLMKDENAGRIMTELVGLRAKMYSVRVENEDSVKKAKGVKGYAVRHTLTFDDYVQCLRENCEIVREQNSIRSIKHTVHTTRQTKVALSPHDDKRVLLPDTPDTLHGGHYKTVR